MPTRSRFIGLATLVLLVATPLANAADAADRPLELLVKSERNTCKATVIPGGKPLAELVPNTELTYKDTARLDDIEFHHVCEVRVAKAAFTNHFGFCALAGGTNGCWMSAFYRGGRDIYFSAGGPGQVEACLYVCTGN